MSTIASTGVGGGSTGAGGSTGGGSTGGGGTTASFMWGDGWRDQMARGSTDVDKERQRLERFQSPDDVYRSFRTLEGKQSRGELKPALPAGASPDEIARWRSENGVPAKPEDYKVNMPAGRQAPKEDDSFLKAFLKSAHDSNMSQGHVDAAVSSFYAEVDRQKDQIVENDKTLSNACEDQLRKDWGGDYRTNKAMAEGLLTRAPAGFRDRFMNGYLADHTPIKASPDAWKWLVSLEREINPAATVVPGAGGDIGKSIDTELADLKKMMGDRTSEYWKGPKAEANQKRYRDLVDAQTKLAAKKAA